MRALAVDNYIITVPLMEVINRLRLNLTNGKLKDVLPKSDNIICTCPHHGGGHEATPACNIYVGDNEGVQYGYFRCFVCEEQGSFVKFTAECLDSGEEYAKKWLIDNFGELAFEKIITAEPISLGKALNPKKTYTKYIDKSLLEGYQSYCPYLAKRKISRETAENLKIKYDPKYRQIVFPCFDEKGNILMLPKRSIDTKTFYLDKDVEKPVYCLNLINKNNVKKAVITEGPFDCATGWEYGMPTIATFGTPSDEQIAKINKSCLNVLYTMFDNDEAGRSFTEKLKRKISKRILLIEVQIPANKKDINDLSFDEFREALKRCQA